MNKTYQHLSLHERYEIADGLNSNLSIREIAKNLDRSPSTIKREIDRHKIKNISEINYKARLANDLSVISRKSSYRERRKLGYKFETELGVQVYEKLQKNWSPEQISAWLRKEVAETNDGENTVSHETIYKTIYIQPRGDLRKELLGYLRKHHKNRMPRSRGENRKCIKDMVNISERPAEAQDRAVPGHWEGDLIKGSENKSAVGTLVERSSRKTILVHLKNATTESVIEGFTKAFEKIPECLRKTMTYDQGREMANHVELSNRTGIKVYFCDPHSPWQRPSNENMNGFIREYLPKSTDLSVFSQEDLDVYAELLNNRPRKVLGFNTPNEVFNDLILKEKFENVAPHP
jgi:IS30 family transposase